jgi:hypothetical protein
MIADLQHTKLALFNNRIAAQDPFRPISSNNTNQRRPPNNNNASRQNHAHPTQQTLYATTVEDEATLLIDA